MYDVCSRHDERAGATLVKRPLVADRLRVASQTIAVVSANTTLQSPPNLLTAATIVRSA